VGGSNYKKFKLIIYLFWSLFIATTGVDSNKMALAETEWEKITTINSDYIRILESIPTGILAGEYDSRTTIEPPPYNGVFFSEDFGKSWKKIGLNNRGILDLKYYEGKIYAATYYTIDYSRGYFVSEDFGESWENIGPNVSPTKIDRDSETIYLGTRHYGVYTSRDEGQTWEKIWEGSGTSLRISEIQSSEEITFASTLSKTYKTTDNGVTWEEIEELNNLTISTICINGDTIFAGATGTSGLYRSSDRGITWEKMLSFGNYSVDKIIYFEGIYYAGRYNPETEKYSVYSSSDEGETWQDIGLNLAYIDNVISLNVLVSEPSYLFSAVSTKGLHKYQIPIFEPSKHPFLDIPWEYQNENELTDKITSYFDHSYPLLGYSYFKEPEEEKNSTLNFLGYKNLQPFIYYSSHSGTDFGLKYGTEILAPAPGYASYYYCKDCGNSIKIDHENGYQTTYMHLQDEDLLTKKDKIWVNNNDIIGKVGLTGRTSGPHLHFEVTKDRDMDNTFSNDFPMGRTDPFGWQVKERKDPWEIFAWEDSLGDHQGTSSFYLWNSNISKGSQLISGDTSSNENTSLILDNKTIEFQNPQNTFTSKIFAYIQPVLDATNSTLSYINNTSFILEAFDQIGNKITEFNNPINISIDINLDYLQNINPESLSLYFWNEVLKTWEKIPSFFDEQMGKIHASVNHLSWFAVFGEKIDILAPETEIVVLGSQREGWYTEYPLIQLTVGGSNPSDVQFTLYSTDLGDFWHEYFQPFYLEQNGIINLIYKSQDLNGNMEKEKNIVLHINTNGSKTQKLEIKEAGFDIQQIF
jgi:murein DD-endopeptidase MepM/ murein hydrolase activator NlpD